MILDGAPWFFGSDILQTLFGQAGGKASAYHKLDATQVRKVDRMALGMKPGRQATVVAEGGLYKLVMRSDKFAVKDFQDWVTREVLPSIRETGSYNLADHGRDQMPCRLMALRLYAPAKHQ